MATGIASAVTSAALSDMGLGDQVKQQLEDSLADRQKKKNVQAAGRTDQINMGATIGSGTQSSILSPAVQDIFGTMR